MKKYTEKNAVSVIGKMLRGMKNEPRESLRYTYIDGVGRQCSCDGYRAYRLNKPVEGLPDMPAHLKGIDLDKIFPAAADLLPLPLPSLDDVKAVCAADRVNKSEPRRYQWAFGDGLPVVNAQYLRDMMQVFPDAVAMWRGLYSPILFVSAHGDGVLLPMRYQASPRLSAEENAQRQKDFQTPRQIPRQQAAPRVPVFSSVQFAARYAA